MPADDTIRIDHDAAATRAAKIRAQASDADSECTRRAGEIKEAMVSETSAHTRDGQTAPVFVDVNRAISDFLDRVREFVHLVAERMNDTADEVDAYSKNVAATAEDSATAINSTDVAK